MSETVYCPDPRCGHPVEDHFRDGCFVCHACHFDRESVRAGAKKGSASVTVLEIVAEYLRREGYDGLVAEDRECACLLDDLAPCGEIQGACEPGHKVVPPYSEEQECENCDPAQPCEWHVIAGRRP